MSKVRVYVTENDIQRAYEQCTPENSIVYNCPIALALQRQTGYGKTTNEYICYNAPNFPPIEKDTTPKLRKFMRAFDRTINWTPMDG